MTAQTTPTGPRCPYRLDGAGSDIHGEAAALRALGPAARAELPGGIPVWAVTDPGLIRRLLTSPKISKDASQHWPAYISSEIPAGWPLRIWVDVRNALSAYGAEHSRLRRPLVGAFSGRRVRALKPQIEAIAEQLLDELPPAGGGTVDLRARFAWRLPLLVVNAVLGVPEALHDAFRDVIGQLFATDLTAEQANAAGTTTYQLLGDLVDIKTAHPGDDVTSTLITSHNRGELNRQELLDSLMLLIGAGHETTVNLLDHTISALLTHPEQRQLAVDGRVTWDQVIEESLRWQAPIATIIMRFAVDDVHDDETGLTFQAGDALVINYAGAGRDPAAHGPTAGDFDVTRHSAEGHLAFGHGVHYCIGAPLARLEAAIALPALFTRHPGLRLAVAPDALVPLGSLISNGHQQLPVVL